MRFAKLLKTSSGFSLMEMLLVSAILPVVFFAVFANLSSGLRTWKTLHEPASNEDTILFLDRARSDFASALVYTPLPFEGDSSSVSFAGVIQAPEELGGERGIGRIRYTYDASKKAVVREESTISDLYKEAPPRRKIMMTDVLAFSVEYLVSVPGEPEPIWKAEWQAASPSARPIPPAVRLKAGRSSGSALIKTFLVPSGN